MTKRLIAAAIRKGICPLLLISASAGAADHFVLDNTLAVDTRAAVTAAVQGLRHRFGAIRLGTAEAEVTESSQDLAGIEECRRDLAKRLRALQNRRGAAQRGLEEVESEFDEVLAGMAHRPPLTDRWAAELEGRPTALLEQIRDRRAGLREINAAVEEVNAAVAGLDAETARARKLLGKRAGELELA